MEILHLEVMGVSHRQAAFDNAKVKMGDLLELLPEPENKYDRNAVAVRKNNISFGYIPRHEAKRLQSKVQAGLVTCKAEAVWPSGCCIELTVADEPRADTVDSDHI
jgi:hypothetical protein